MAGEKPAARLTDMHVCPLVTGLVAHVGGPIAGPGCPTVLIGGLPAARVSDMAICVGPPDTIVQGSATVLIGCRPAARMGDLAAHGGVIVIGFPTVLIGDMGSAPTGFGAMIAGALKAIVLAVREAIAPLPTNTPGAALADAIATVNPSGNVENCGNIINAAAARLNGGNPAATAPAGRDGSFPEIEQRFRTKLSWGSNFHSAFHAVSVGGDGTMAIVGIAYSGGSGSHVVLLANDHGTVGIVEAQNWGPGNPPEVIIDVARANTRYNPDGGSNIGWGLIPR